MNRDNKNKIVKRTLFEFMWVVEHFELDDRNMFSSLIIDWERRSKGYAPIRRR